MLAVEFRLYELPGGMQCAIQFRAAIESHATSFKFAPEHIPVQPRVGGTASEVTGVLRAFASNAVVTAAVLVSQGKSSQCLSNLLY